MAPVAALLDSRGALGSLRRSMPRHGGPVLACRSVTGLEAALGERLLEAVVLGTRAIRSMDFAALRARFPGIPVVAYGVFRSDDADLLLAWQRLDVAAVAVEGVDDPVVGDLVMRHSVSVRRRAALSDAPRLLRLTEPLQRRAWDMLVASIGRPPRTALIAGALGMSREHLSRQFGAGGAPNLKRVADLLTVLAALALLRNPACPPTRVARLLGLSTPSHLRAMVRRISGAGLAEALGLSDAEVLRRFLKGSGRSRT
ncbi:MAG TPA: helix-turn-helix domain-containing protein [Gemmatimonadales bacterium]|nr:helix-turn-helix domain-containing protein [Gemmatimonadales bacterium]